MKPAATDPMEATVHVYERLRSACLAARSALAGELGLNLLLRHGMLAWARAGQAVLAPARAPAAPLDTARVPAPLHEDIINLMVAMAIGPTRSAEHGALPA